MPERESPRKAKRYIGNSLERILKVRSKHMKDFIKPPLIGSGIETFKTERHSYYRALTIHVNRALTNAEMRDPNFYYGVRVKYIADGIDAQPKE